MRIVKNVANPMVTALRATVGDVDTLATVGTTTASNKDPTNSSPMERKNVGHLNSTYRY